jgi:hypothetical protein
LLLVAFRRALASHYARTQQHYINTASSMGYLRQLSPSFNINRSQHRCAHTRLNTLIDVASNQPPITTLFHISDIHIRKGGLANSRFDEFVTGVIGLH